MHMPNHSFRSILVVQYYVQEDNHITEHCITCSVNQFQIIFSDTHQMIFHYNDHVKGETLAFSCTLHKNFRSPFRYGELFCSFIHQKANICYIASCFSRHCCKLDTGREKSVFKYFHILL